MAAAEPDLRRAGIALAEIRRGWDDAVWPQARAGYFKGKAKNPDILADRGLWTGPPAPVQMPLFPGW